MPLTGPCSPHTCCRRAPAQASAVFEKGFVGVISLVVRLSTKPLLAFFTCGFEGDRLKLLRESLAPASEEAGTLLGQPDKLQQLVKGGFPAVLGAILGVFSQPIGEGLRDPELAGAISGALRLAGDKLSQPDFLTKLKQGVLKGVLVEVARIAKKPFVAALARVVGDDDFKTALDGSYDKLLAALSPEQLTTGGLIGVVRQVAPEWIRFILVKGVTWLTQQLPAVKARLEQTADALANLAGTLTAEQGALAGFGTTLRDAARAATAQGLPAFSAGWLECTKALPTDDVLPQLKAAAGCLATAAKSAFSAAVTAVKETVAPKAEEPTEAAATPEEKAAAVDTPPPKSRTCSRRRAQPRPPSAPPSAPRPAGASPTSAAEATA